MESKPEVAPADQLKVTLGDIAKHAKQQCKTCFGRGFVTRITREPSVGGEMQEFRRDVPCACALNRFAKHVRAGGKP